MKDINIVGITKKYGGNIVLDDVSLVIPAGKSLAVMGASGCGKTTLAGILLGIVKPDSGYIENLPEKIGVVFQENRLCEQFTARENIELVLTDKAKKEKIPEAFDKVGLSECIDKRVCELSGGQKRRVAILRALMYEPEFLILDEPFSGLDTDSKKLVMDYIIKYSKDMTVLFITHDREEAEYMASGIFALT